MSAGAISRSAAHRRAARLAPLLAVLVVGGSFGLTGCGRIIRAAINHATHGKLDQDENAVNQLTSKMQSAESETFDVSYQTTGVAPAIVRVAAMPPKDFAFVDTASNGAVSADLIQNASGSDYCSRAASGNAKYQCTKLSSQTISTYDAMKALYTPQYWIDFLNAYKYAGVVGVSITNTTMTVNGFALTCIVATGSAGSTTTSSDATAPKSTVCVTSQGVLGYVKVSSDSTAFEIKSYSTSPPSSLFQVPAGATITTLPSTTTTTS